MANFMEKYKEFLKYEESLFGGPHKVYKFPNNYGASVIQNDYSYGGERGLWEIDVLGYLTDEEVCEILEQIKNL